MSNEVQVMNTTDMGYDLEVDLATAKKQYCSLIAETPEEKLTLFNLTNMPTGRLADMINIPLAVTDVYVEIVKCTNKNTGINEDAPRTVLLTQDGNSYQCVSRGIFNALAKLFHIYGMPHWDTPVMITPQQINKGELRILTFKVELPGGKKK